MAGEQKIITQRNTVKQPQFVVEGITTASYNLQPTNPAFIPIGHNTMLVDTSAPLTVEQAQSGDVDRREKTRIAKKFTMTIQTQMTFLELSLLQWALVKPVIPFAADTPDESRYFFDSYLDINDVEIFRKFSGCKPISWNFAEDRAGYRVLEITCECADIVEDAVLPVLGSGSFAGANSNPSYKHQDAGPLPFLYDGEAFTSSNFISTGTLVQAPQDAIGNETTLYTVPTQRRIAGSMSIYKKGNALQNDAKAVDESKDAVFTFDAAQGLSIAFTKFLWLPSNEPRSGDDSAAIMENKSYESEAVTVVDV